MITYSQWTARFPEFIVVPTARFDIFVADAVLEMGTDDGRWINVYEVAQANLVAHYITLANRSATGDSSPMFPAREKEVDEVRVEYALGANLASSFDALNATVYGQSYIRWRRQAFSGPRVA